MVLDRKTRKKYVLVVACMAAFALLLSGPFTAAETAQGSGGEAVHEETPEGADGGGHETDRTGDLLDLLYRFINFALLIIILVIALRKVGLKETLAGRIEGIRQSLDDLKEGKKEAETKYKEMEKKLQEFQEKKKEIVDQYKKEGMAEKERIVAAAKERAKHLIEQAELTIELEVQSVRDQLKRDVVDLAVQRAREIIAKEITEEDQGRLVDEFIERVGKIH